MVVKRSADAAAAVLPSKEEDFPRGGGGALTALERRQAREEGRSRAKRELSQGPRPSKKRKPSRDAEDGEDTFFAREALQGRLPKYVELLKFKSLSEGAKVWGCVAEIHPKELIVSLPHGLRGRVSGPEVSDVLADKFGASQKAGQPGKSAQAGPPPLQELFSVGQLVRCSILALHDKDSSNAPHKGKRAIELSLHVAKVNEGLSLESLSAGLQLAACVRSIEDHGFLLSLGIQGMSAFLEKTNWVKACGGLNRPLLPGALLEVVVTAAPKPGKRMVHVSVDPKAKAKAVAKEWEGLTIGSLLPGMLVNAKVRNVLSDGLLVSFLTFFNGTIDCFHLSQELMQAGWQSSFEPGQKLRARILYVDATSKRVCLTLLPYLLAGQSAPSLPKGNTLFQDAVIRRVDPGLGVLLELRQGEQPSSKAAQQNGASKDGAAPVAGYAHISALSDKRVDKLEKAYKPGRVVTARATGARPMDGLAVCTLKPSAVEGGALSYEDIAPGQLMSGTVDGIEDFGVFVKLAVGVKGLVPSQHAAGASFKKSSMKVGQKVAVRVLACDAPNRRLTLTMKKLLLEEKLAPFTSWEAVEVGQRAHGYVTGVKEYGAFVAFCGGVKGLVPLAELGLEPNQDAGTHFPVGKVVIARVISIDHDAQRMRLSLAPKTGNPAAEAAAGDPAGGLQPGDLVEGIIANITSKEVGGEALPGSLMLTITTASGAPAQGRLEAEHLADHPAAVRELQEAVAVGAKLGPLLVLERLEKSSTVKVTMKASLVRAAQSLPSSIEDLKPHALIPGYVASVTPDAVFVRFLGSLTGRAGLPQLADNLVSDPQQHFVLNQSVRALVASVDLERGRFALVLKHSMTGAADGLYAESLFESQETAEMLRAGMPNEGAESDWAKTPIGSIARGAVHDVKDYGIVCDLAANPDVVGLVAPQQAGGAAKAGAPIKARVLDISKKDGVVDLSLKPALTAAGTKKAAEALASTEVGQKLDAVVELDKEDYLVLSFPERAGVVGFAATSDLNLQAQRSFSLGQKLQATVVALPCESTGGRLLVHVPVGEAADNKKREPRASKRPTASPGSLVSGTVLHVLADHATVQLDNGDSGRIHITEAADSTERLTKKSPLAKLQPGEAVKALVIGAAPLRQARTSGLLELSIRPARLSAAQAGNAGHAARAEAPVLAPGRAVTGYVIDTAADCVWLAVSPAVRGRLHALDCCDAPQDMPGFAAGFQLGQKLRCHVLKVEKNKHFVDFTTRDPEAAARLTVPPREGEVVNAQITSLSGSGVRAHLPAARLGHIGLTDLHDSFTADALSGLAVGDFVRCKCLISSESGGGSKSKKRKRGHDLHASGCQLSLRPSHGAWHKGAVSAPVEEQPAPETLDVNKLKKGQQVSGYVKAVSSAGVFVALARNAEARVKMGHLSDSFVKDPKAAFPEGKLVHGRVISSADGRVELSLRSTAPKAMIGLEDLREGQTVTGRVKRVETYGAFISLAGSGLTGLCHISEVADERVTDLPSMLQPGQAVKAKVIGVDLDAQKLSLGLKPSYFEGEDSEGDADQTVKDVDEEAFEAAAELDSSDEDMELGMRMDDTEQDAAQQKGLRHQENADDDDEDDEDTADSDDAGEAEEKGALSASTAAELSQHVGKGVGWIEDDEAPQQLPQSGDEAGGEVQPLTKRQRKRAKQLEEDRIRAAEQRQLQQPSPQSVLDYERLVLESPNDSHPWIRFMAFHVELGEVAKARSVAEKALQTIHFREEREKLNVWVAYLNLENTYGSPLDEAVMKLFQRALQHVDQKKLYLALLTILESTQKDELAQQVIKAMCRKFAASAKIALRAYGHAAQAGDGEGARRALDRSLTSLQKRKHIKVLSQAALIEFHKGSADRGRSIFEGILRNFPKRLDLWSVYLDQEVRLGDRQRIRSLFERATHMQLPPKKMKFLFKRFLDYEKSHGDAGGVEHVKQAAREYVEANLAEA